MNLIKLIYIPIITMMLISCNKSNIVYKDRIVEVPIVVIEAYQRPPKINDLDNLPIDMLSESDKNNHEKISEAFAISVQMLKGKITEYKAAIQPYYSKFNK